MTLKFIFTWIVILCRIGVGLLVMKTGFDFMRGYDLFAYRDNDGITGIFIMIIGAYIAFSSLFHGLFEQTEDDLDG